MCVRICLPHFVSLLALFSSLYLNCGCCFCSKTSLKITVLPPLLQACAWGLVEQFVFYIFVLLLLLLSSAHLVLLLVYRVFCVRAGVYLKLKSCVRACVYEIQEQQPVFVCLSINYANRHSSPPPLIAMKHTSSRDTRENIHPLYCPYTLLSPLSSLTLSAVFLLVLSAFRFVHLELNVRIVFFRINFRQISQTL